MPHCRRNEKAQSMQRRQARRRRSYSSPQPQPSPRASLPAGMRCLMIALVVSLMMSLAAAGSSVVVAFQPSSSAIIHIRQAQSSAQGSASRRSSRLALTSFWGDSKQLPSAAEDVEDAPSAMMPFVIDPIERDALSLIEDVSDMCVEVFFNEDSTPNSSSSGSSRSNNNSNVTPWKALQLMYLKNMQVGDLRMKFFQGQRFDMFVAREVRPATASVEGDDKLLVEDEASIYNPEYLDDDDGAEGYVRGDVLGFVEVTEKRFRLGQEYESADVINGDDGSGSRDMRPFLSNLSVRNDARNSGVGSALVDRCEDAVLNQWGSERNEGGSESGESGSKPRRRRYDEIVLQVEDDNAAARSFYEKRGYEALFADPACRRYDTSQLILRQVRTTKVCMRKRLGYGGGRGGGGRGGGGVGRNKGGGGSNKTSANPFGGVLDSLRGLVQS